MRAPLAVALLPWLAVACDPKGGAGLGGGPEKDGRLVADIYTWECLEGADTSGVSAGTYEGVYAFNVSLEYAPDALGARSLPGPGGCSWGLSMFGMDADSTGSDIPDLDDQPRWRTGTLNGELDELSTGFFYDEAFNNVHTCQDASDVMEGGVELYDAGPLDGVATPTPSTLGDVTLTGALDEVTGFQFGDEIDVTWDAGSWDSTWIQLRRERDGEAWESVTCNTTGLESYTIGTAVWDLLDPELPVTTNNVYVGFQNQEQLVLDDGQKFEAAARAMHVALIIE